MVIADLTSDAVHTWCVPLDVPEEVWEARATTLSNDERVRSGRFRFEPDRRRFESAHGVLRELLGQVLGTDPTGVRIVEGKSGKPELGPEYGRRLNFNLSHSGDRALIALAIDAEVGADIERIRADADAAEIARCFFAADENEYLSRVPEALRVETFFSFWTLKEAYLKARGEGLGVSPASFSVLRLGGGWSAHSFLPAPDYAAAVIAEGLGRRHVPHEWLGVGPAISPRRIRTSAPRRAPTPL